MDDLDIFGSSPLINLMEGSCFFVFPPLPRDDDHRLICVKGNHQTLMECLAPDVLKMSGDFGHVGGPSKRLP